MRKRVAILEFREEQMVDAGLSAESLHLRLGLSRDSSITLHADGRLVVELSEEDLPKADMVKGMLGEPKNEKTVVVRRAEPPPPQPTAEIAAAGSEIECPFCRARLRLKSAEMKMEDGVAESLSA